MDPTEQCFIYCATGQSPSAAVCRETGKDNTIYDQGESFDITGPR